MQALEINPPAAKRRVPGLLLPFAGLGLVLVFVVMIAWQYLNAGAERAPVVAGSETPATSYVLANGLRVVVGEDHRAPIVHVMTIYRTGASADPAARAGLAHSLEHAMFGGTRDVPAQALYDVASRMGGGMNAFTAQDETRFVFGAPRRYMPVILALEADRMQHLRIAASRWQTERGAVLGEIAQAESDPLRVLLAGVRRAALPGPRGEPAIGRRESVERIDVAALRAAYEQRFRPGNATLIVVGDVTAAAVLRDAQRSFGGVRARGGSAAPPPADRAPNADGTGTFRMPAAVAAGTVDVALHAPGERSNDFFDALLLAYALGAESSPVRRTLVDAGIVQSLQVVPDLRAPSGLIHVVVTLQPGHSAAQARDALQRALRSLADSPALADLYREGQSALRSQLVLADDDVSGHAARLDWEYYPSQHPRNELRELDAASYARVAALLRAALARPLAFGEIEPNGALGARAAKPELNAQMPEAIAPSRDAAGLDARSPRWLTRLVAGAGDRTAAVPPATVFALSNGLRVHYVRERGIRGFYLTGFVAGSTRGDPAGKEGVAAAMSQLLAAGGKRGDLRKLTRRAASEDISVQLGQRFVASGPATRFGDTLGAVADALIDPSFPASGLDVVRRQMRDAAVHSNPGPDALANRLFDQQLVPRDDAALRRPTAASIDALLIDDVTAFAATHLRPDATVIAIVADLDPAQVRRDVQAAFGEWQRPAAAPAADQTAIRDWSPSRKVVVAPAQAEHLIIGQPVPGSGDVRYPSLLLANELLGVGFDSRLVQALRFRRGLALAATSALIANPGRGILRIDTRVPPDRSREAARLVGAELTRLGRDLVTGDELARARAQLESATLMAHEQPARLAQAELDQGLAVRAGGRVPFDRLSGVTPARLRDDMRAILAPGRLAEVDVGPAR